MRKKILGTAFSLAVGLGLLATAPQASAAVIGQMDLANCSGGGVIVTGTTIDWTQPVGGGTGCIVTGQNTNITYTSGTLGPGATGTILDLNSATTVFPLADFMTFSSASGLHFDLTSLGPGPANTTCTASFDPNAPACAVFAGSPFILQSTATGTSVTLSASGIARDMSTTTSTWVGAYTTQIAGVTPAQIQSTILRGGSETSTYSGAFVITVNSAVPEPATFGSMLIGGLLLAGASLRRKLVRG